MQDLTFKKQWLIATMKENLDDHRTAFLEAQEKYRETVIERLDETLKLAREGKNFDLRFGFVAPQDHTEDYNRVISMLQNCEGDTITIAEHEYSQYILDRWDWKQQFVSTANAYGVRSKGASY